MRIPAFIKQLAKFCDSESSRYALGGVQCVSDGKTAQLTATDGRCLAAVTYDDDDEITPKAVSAIVDAGDMPNAPVFKSPVFFDGKVWSQAGKAVLTSTPVEGRFPRIEDVFDKANEPGYVRVKLDAALLRKLCDLSHALNDDDHTKGITLFVKDAASAVFATTRSTSGHVARMAIMPRYSDGYKPDDFPPRPGAAQAADKPAAESGKQRRKAVAAKTETPPPPEMMDDEQVAAAIAEPGDWSVDLPPV